jgi:hypothetical protein
LLRPPIGQGKPLHTGPPGALGFTGELTADLFETCLAEVDAFLALVEGG